MRLVSPAGPLLLLMLTLGLAQSQESPRLILPTDNNALLRGDKAEFYQVIERNFHGVISYPWEGGQYGFVRDPVETGHGLIYKRFHEGIDIRPMRRDAGGEPLDEIHAIAQGKVVYTSTAAGASNYGRYVVIEHEWGGCPYYSLYGHLSTIAVTVGQTVRQGEEIAVMGHTGTGITRERAHVHLELNLLISTHFGEWHNTVFRGETNRHGVYNGINLVGIDIARLYLSLQTNPSLTIPEFVRREKLFYKVLVPYSANFELPQRYPWMVTSSPGSKTKSWEVSFARSSLPLRLEPKEESVSAAKLTFIESEPDDYRYLTRDVVGGRAGKAYLTKSGQALMRLLTFPD